MILINVTSCRREGPLRWSGLPRGRDHVLSDPFMEPGKRVNRYARAQVALPVWARAFGLNGGDHNRFRRGAGSGAGKGLNGGGEFRPAGGRARASVGGLNIDRIEKEYQLLARLREWVLNASFGRDVQDRAPRHVVIGTFVGIKGSLRCLRGHGGGKTFGRHYFSLFVFSLFDPSWLFAADRGHDEPLRSLWPGFLSEPSAR